MWMWMHPFSSSCPVVVHRLCAYKSKLDLYAQRRRALPYCRIFIMYTCKQKLKTWTFMLARSISPGSMPLFCAATSVPAYLRLISSFYQLQNQMELRASSAERAASFLDAALAARKSSGMPNDQEVRRNSHFLFTLHLYQERLDKSNKATSECVHGRNWYFARIIKSCCDIKTLLIFVDQFLSFFLFSVCLLWGSRTSSNKT